MDSVTDSPTTQSKADHYDAFIAYRRADGAALAKWIRRRLKSFRLPEEILADLPPDKRALHARRPDVFLDTAYEKPSDDWLNEKVFPALDNSDRLIVISTPFAFESIKKNGREEPNWLTREIDRFLGNKEEISRKRPVDVVIGPRADLERYPGRLNDIEHRDPIDLRHFSGLRSYGVGSRLDDGVAKLIAGLYDVPNRHLPLLYKEESRQRRKHLLINAYTLLFTLAAVSLLSYVVSDYIDHQRAIVQRTDEAQGLIDNQQFEQAMRVAVEGLPVDYDFPWRPHWTDLEARRLLAKLAGAAQLSAYTGQLADEKYPIQSASFDYTGSKIVAASQGGTVSVWDSGTRARIITCSQDKVFQGAKVTRPAGSTDWVRDSRFGGAGHAVLSVGRYGAWIWQANCPDCKDDQDTARCTDAVRMVGHTKDVRTGAFSRDLKFVVTTSDDDTARVWDASDGEQLGLLELPPPLLPPGYRYTTSADVSPDGQSIAVSRRDGLVAIVDFVSRRTRVVLQETGAAVWSVRFDKVGKRIVSASENGEVAIWTLSSGAKTALPRHPSAVSSASFSPDGRPIVTTSLDRTARVWDAAKLTQLFTLKGHEGPVLSAGFSPDGNRIVTSSDDRTVRIWSSGPDIIPSVIRSSSYPLTSGAMNDDGHYFVAGGFDGHILLYKIGDDHVVTKDRELDPKIGVITSVGFGATPNRIIFSSDSGAVMLWDAAVETNEMFFQLPKNNSFVAVSPMGDLVVTSSSIDDPKNYNRVWDLQSRTWWSLEDANRVSSVEFSHDGKRVLAASEAATPSGKRLATVWIARTGRKMASLEHDAPVLSAHFSRDGRRIATASLDYKAHVWDATTGKEIQVFNGHTYDVKSARFSPEGERIVTASSDRTVRVWDVQTATQMLQFSIGIDATDAFFTQDGNHVLVTTAEGEILNYDVAWTAGLDKELRSRVCRAKLADLDKSHACLRVGALSILRP
jgi:WD40 repeat protein